MSLDQALACGLDHLSAYGLTYEEGTLLYRQHEKGRVTPVPEEDFVAMYRLLQDRMAAAGFIQYEISNWARPGRECRHNLLYWDRDDYLAFGVSAHGFYQGEKFSIPSSVPAYLRLFQSLSESKVDSYFSPDLVVDHRRVDDHETASDAMIFGLRKCIGVHEPSFAGRFGYTPSERWPEAIQKHIQRGNMEQQEDRLRLASEAYLISNEVMLSFLD